MSKITPAHSVSRGLALSAPAMANMLAINSRTSRTVNSAKWPSKLTRVWLL